MGATTAIGWTDATWNPVSGCTKVSAGCKHCYAETLADRFWGDRKFTDVELHPARLMQPLRWRKPRRVFVNSMSDLFHDDVPESFLDEVFAMMAFARLHQFQVLTKRPERMRAYIAGARDRLFATMHALGRNMVELLLSKSQLLVAYARSYDEWERLYSTWPLENVWLGVSVENQSAADERIPILVTTPAAVRFLSCEPLLAPLDLGTWFWSAMTDVHRCAIDWCIVGGESGRGHRPMDVAWLSSIVAQCDSAGVPVFVKQSSGPRAGQQGRIPAELWARKEYPA